MQFLNKKIATALAHEWGYQVDEDTILDNELDLYNFPFPKHREGMGYLAREITKLLTDGNRLLLLITEFGIWPSMEDHNLFNRFRRELGCDADFPGQLGHIFNEGERDDIATYLHLMIIFGWGGFIFVEAQEDSRIALFVSHDSWGRFACGRRKVEKVEAFVTNWIEISNSSK